MLFAILRFVIPLIIFIVIAGLVWPYLRRINQKNQTDRIEVEAEVVKSEQHKPEYPKSETYSSEDSEK